jgi:hypothetical protein
MTLDPVRYSRLKLMALSPAHYQAAAVEETYAMERGSAVDAMVFGTQEVLAWGLNEKGNQRPRTGKDYDAFAADHPGALILTTSEYQEARTQADAVRSSTMAMRLLDGNRQNEITWRFGPRACAGRPDVWVPSHVTELKCTVSSQPRRFRRQARSLGYCGQIVWYMDGLAAAGLAAPEAGYIVAVEGTAPFVVTVFRLNQTDIDRGRRDYRAWFEQLMVCEAANEWPGYSQAVVELGAYDDDVELDFTGVEAA